MRLFKEKNKDAQENDNAPLPEEDEGIIGEVDDSVDVDGEPKGASPEKSDSGKNASGIVGMFGKIRAAAKGEAQKIDRQREAHDIIYRQNASEKIPDTTNEQVGDLSTVKYRPAQIDTWFLLIVVLLLVFGAVMSFSASSVYAMEEYDDSVYFIKDYIKYAIFGCVGVIILGLIFKTPKTLKLFSVLLYGVSVILLALVPVMGVVRGGAKRWLDFKIITIQPSEIAKMAVVLFMAYYLAKYQKQITSKTNPKGNFENGVLVPVLIFGTVCGLVALEKHISGLLIIGMIGVAMMFMGGTRLKWIFLIIGGVAAAALILILVSDYAQARVDTWININKVDPLGPAWQTLQGMYAIGSGSFFGLGLGNSRQKYGYVSQPQNDFVFTIICEELGFVGAVLVVGLFGLLVWRGFKIAAHTPDKFSSLVVYGLTFKTALQAMLNIAVVTNSMPNTGVSLPFFSSGGTALIMQIVEMGIILIISRYSVIKK